MAVSFKLAFELLLLLVCQPNGSVGFPGAHFAGPFRTRRGGPSVMPWSITPPLGKTSAASSSVTQLAVSFTPNQFDAARSLGNADATVTKPAEPAFFGQQSSSSSRSSINLPLIQTVCSSQIILVFAAALLAALGGAHHVLPSLAVPVIWSSSASTSGFMAGFTLLLVICFYEWTSQSAFRPASQIDFATSHMVFDMFGRRPIQGPQTVLSDQDQSLTPEVRGEMLVTFLVIGLVCLITAVCQELSFRGYVYDLVVQHLPMQEPNPVASGVAVLVQAALYAALTTSTVDPSGRKLDALPFTFKLMSGFFLGGLAVTSQSLWVCVAVQWMASWHVLSRSWVHVNHHMDWVELQVPPSFADSTNARIPTGTRRSLFRFFCAFDSLQQHGLSLSDVQRAVSFAFWNSPDPPSQEEVRHVYLSCGQRCHDEASTYREGWTGEDANNLAPIDFDAFLDVLMALRRRSP